MQLPTPARPALFIAFVVCASVALFLEWALFLDDGSGCSCRTAQTAGPRPRRGRSALETSAEPSAIGPEASAGPPEIPFDWKFYTSFYADLQGMRRAQAEDHYRKVGRYEGRLAAPVDVRLKYIACGGLCNQLYSHIHALLAARALGGSLLLAPAMRRKSFEAVRQGAAGATVVDWEYAPIEGLLDVDRMEEYWQRRGVRIVRTPYIREAMDPRTRQWNRRYDGQLRYDLPLGERCLTTTYHQPERPLWLANFTRQARAAITAAAQPVLRGDPANQIPCIYLDTHCTFMALNTSRILDRAAEAARGLFFNQTLVSLAGRVIIAMDANGDGFNGLHLRLEKDAQDWHAMVGGSEGLKKLYYEAMKEMQFTSDSTVYVASGLMAYDTDGELDRIRARVKELGLAKQLVFKEELLPPAALAGLHPEQLALVDFLVLLRCRRLVGWGGSSFSFLLRELRAIEGRQRASAHLIYPPGLEGPLGKPQFDAAGVLSG